MQGLPEQVIAIEWEEPEEPLPGPEESGLQLAAQSFKLATQSFTSRLVKKDYDTFSSKPFCGAHRGHDRPVMFEYLLVRYKPERQRQGHKYT